MVTNQVPTDVSSQTKKPLLPLKSKQTRQPIIWALDPTDNDVSRVKPLAETIKVWRHYFPGEILPVSILSPKELNWPIEFVAPLNEKLAYVANEYLKPAVRKAFAEKLLDPHIILQSGFSHRQAAHQLIDYARKRKAQIIAVNTHGRRRLDRFRLGSFAELLLTQDDVPVLALNPHAEPRTEIKTIAFPTDFKKPSKRAFRNAIKLAKSLQAEMRLIHVYTIPNQFFYDGEFGPGVTGSLVEKAWKDAEISQKQEGEHWKQTALDNGVDAEFVFSKDTGRTGELITKAAREQNVDLIYLSTSYGRTGQTFLGGTIRDVLATATVPVLVRHFRETKR